MEPIYSAVVAAQIIPSRSSKRCAHAIARQAVCPSIVVHSISMDSKDPLVTSADPEISVAIKMHGVDAESCFHRS